LKRLLYLIVGNRDGHNNKDIWRQIEIHNTYGR
jgi:hypothetical protein